LFQAALLPGIMLAVLYAGYAFIFALINPSKAPPVQFAANENKEIITRNEGFTWFLAVPVGIIGLAIGMGQTNLVGSQSVIVDSFTDSGQTASLRTNVSEECGVSMQALHGDVAWQAALDEQSAIEAAGGVEQARELSPEERAERVMQKVEAAAPIGSGIAIFAVLMGLMLAIARGVAPSADGRPLIVGAVGVGLVLLTDIAIISPLTTPGQTTLLLAIPVIIAFYGLRFAAKLLAGNEILRVVFPPLVLIVAVLGSILGGITNPTPAAALGAGGAILLATYRKLQDQGRSGRMVLLIAAAIVIMLLVGTNFDMRLGQEVVLFENRLAYMVAFGCFLFALFGLFWCCWVLIQGGVLAPVVRETAKVTSMVFTILIGSQLLNLVLISFGGEHYIQQFLRSFDNEWTVFRLVMLVLFMLGFVLDFLEIIYIVIPIVGPVIYGGTFDPKWVTIMIAVNLQTSFLTPPFGFALFYLRGVAPKSITTGQIYKGVMPFIGIQVFGLLLLAFFPAVVTIVPNLLN
jgi:TRAP-type mannitol/chloroaromatic compound transport system permease large subunit